MGAFEVAVQRVTHTHHRTTGPLPTIPAFRTRTRFGFTKLAGETEVAGFLVEGPAPGEEVSTSAFRLLDMTAA